MESLFDDDEFEKRLFDKCEYLVTIGLWPSRRKIDYISWLKNFTEQEKPYALRLLDNFTHFNDELCNELFREAFIKAGQSTIDYSSSISIQTQWSNFYNSCIICPVRGERPSLADSGYSFVQKARNLFGIGENQFREPEEALKIWFNSWVNGQDCRPIIFVDDFIGSGSQFYTMWTRIHNMFNIEEHSYETMSFKTDNTQIYYCTLFSTESGLSKLKLHCKNVTFCVSHIISSSDNIFNIPSNTWEGNTQLDGIKALESASKRGGIPYTNGKDVYDWKGYGEQGLLLSIRDNAPDASIGAIRWERNGWQPLIIQ